jgi:cation-transporting ATPase E
MRKPSLPSALRSTVAGVVPMVPEGLVLLTSLALATAVTPVGTWHVRAALVADLSACDFVSRSRVCEKCVGARSAGARQRFA